MESRLEVLSADRLKELRYVYVVGDLHGDADSLGRLLSYWDPKDDFAVFIGDYADRGPNGVEVVERVHALLREFPDRIVALKGNHECFTPEGEPLVFPCTIVDEAARKWGRWELFFQTIYRPLIEKLSLAAVIPGEVLFVHGGVSTKVGGIEDLQTPSDRMEEDLLTSDTTTRIRGEEYNATRDAGVRYGIEIAELVCQRLGVKRIIRGHQHELGRLRPGVEHGGRVMTVITSSYYCPEPYVVVLDAADPSKAHQLILRNGEKKPIDYRHLEDLLKDDQIPQINPVQLHADARRAFHQLSSVCSKLLPSPLYLLRHKPAVLPDKESSFEYFEIPLHVLCQDEPARIDGRCFIVEFEPRRRKIRKIYYAENKHALDSFRQIDFSFAMEPMSWTG